MNEAFYALPEERRRAIFNAAMEVFSQWEYKRASTDLIAAKAGVSKGLLFYYFHNKKTLYLETFVYAQEMVSELICHPSFWETADFFERILLATEIKMDLLRRNPYLMDFAVRAYYSNREEVSDALRENIGGVLGGLYRDYFANIDLSKFREGADPVHLLNMLAWMTDGYLHGHELRGEKVDLTELWGELERWLDMFRKIAYKEAYQ